ncbi:MAG TPA: right-handed parallel beta-helix repeat-containing protein [Candidatus Deferrimicrobiaceae bacterium]
MLRFLSSTRLTIALCLVLAALGAVGAFLYTGATSFASQGSINLYRSPLFLAPALLLALNVACCAFTRLRTGQFRGFRAAVFLGLHAGLVMLMAGLVVDARFAFVGTQLYRVGERSAAYFDWRDNVDKSFPFTVEALGYTERYHPMDLQIGIRDASGGKHGPFHVREGVPFDVPGTGLTVVPRRFDISRKALTFDASLGDLRVTGIRTGSSGASAPGGFTVVPVAWADPEIAEYVARVRFVRPGIAPEVEEIRINHPGAFGGFTFCLTVARPDETGSRVIGLQMTREPGAPWFWAGALLFGVSLSIDLFRKARRAAPLGAAVLLIPAVLSFACPGDAAAFGRSISAEESWEGTVKITEPVTVEKGATLTIRPGTVVLLSGDEHGEAGVPDGGLKVFGKLRVEGERGRPVRFARLDPARPWNEVFMKEADVVIRYALFEGALWGLHIHDGDVTIARTTLRGNGGGARLKGTGARFDRCSIVGNEIGLRFWDGGPRITASVISGNRTGLFYRDGAGGGKINGCRIENLEVDAKIGDWAKGGLDLSGNYWGGRKPKLRDFRNPGTKEKIPVSPVLKRRPVAGAD